jgi:carboxyl-terminal processing protease
LDTNLTIHQIAMQDFKDTDSYLKLTLSKLYRITGNSAQKKGVIPDLFLPDFYAGFYHKESGFKNALVSDSVKKKTYFTPMPAFPIEKLKQQSEERSKDHSVFESKIQAHDSILVFLNQSKTGIDLSYDSFSERYRIINRLTEKLSAGNSNENKAFSVSNTSYEEKILEMDEYYRELNQEVLKDISGDVLLTETFQIMNDLINFTKK